MGSSQWNLMSLATEYWYWRQWVRRKTEDFTILSMTSIFKDMWVKSWNYICLCFIFLQLHWTKTQFQAWRLWNEGRPIELMDALMETRADTSELLRCIHVGLLCVQKRPEDRPTMPSVVLMLDSENPTLPQPKQPGFYSERYLTETDSSSTGTFRNTYTMMKDVMITTVQGR
jgi:hypothetical protein